MTKNPFNQKQNIDPAFLVVDLFCGAGGTTTGFEMTNGKALVIACVNHDSLAIKSHWENHQHVEHYEEDITKLYGYIRYNTLFMSERMRHLVRTVNLYRAMYPKAKLILWASLECTNFSNAKGGQSRDADSRTLANHLFAYIYALNPDIIQIENVVEFMSWGPLRIKAEKSHETHTELKFIFNKKKKREEYAWEPESRKSGKDFINWCQCIDAIGYRNDWREMNSANYGAYTSRNRLFGMFAKPEIPIVWPDATHAKEAKPANDLFGKSLKRWMPVRDVLDFTDEGKSIFNRKIPIVDNSLERIYAGLIKFVAGGEESFMVKYNSRNKDGKYTPPSIDQPSPVLAVQQRIGMAFITKNYSGKPKGKVLSVDSPAGTITTVDHHALINSMFIAQRNSGKPSSKVVSVDVPARTLTATAGNQDLVTTNFLSKYHGNGFNAPLDQPSPTIATKDQISLIVPKYFISRDFKQVTISSVDSPAGSMTTVPKLNLVEAIPYWPPQRAFIFNPQWFGHPASIDNPCPFKHDMVWDGLQIEWGGKFRKPAILP